jgi:hypothetical protein
MKMIIENADSMAELAFISTFIFSTYMLIMLKLNIKFACPSAKVICTSLSAGMPITTIMTSFCMVNLFLTFVITTIYFA